MSAPPANEPLDVSLDQTVASGTSSVGPGVLGRGAAIGRYLVLSLLGRGGMGEVYAAYDPELDRRVALKLLYTARDTEDAKARLLREARALGKLSHPNVVQVHDVGEHQGNVFVAMELVEGESLEAYCKSEPRPGWRAVVAAYLEAARGLAAAHEKELVHRDVKPANILRGKDGRVRVADFGIAAGREGVRVEHSPAPNPALRAPRVPEGAVHVDETMPAPSSAESLPAQLTATGMLMGTPLYLAPEQYEGLGASPASDQYSLCIAMYEGLYGAPPFATEMKGDITEVLADLHHQKTSSGPGPPPAGTGVPAWVHEVVARGLRPNPEDRYPSLEELIAALSRDPDARRPGWRRSAGLAAGAAALVAVAVAGWARSGRASDPCEHPERQLAGVWDDGVKGRVRAAFLGTGRPYAEGTIASMFEVLDRHAAEWARMRGEVCEASRGAGQRPEILALRDACLDRRRDQLGALTGLFAEKPDPDVLNKAVQAAQGLAPSSHCADTEALTARVRPPEDAAVRGRVAALQPRVDRLEALWTAGKFKDGLALGEPILAEAAEVGYAPLRAQAEYAVSRLRDGDGDYDGAKASLRAAAASAAEGKDDVLAALAWARLLFIVGERQRRFEEATVIRDLGPSILSRVQDGRAQGAWLNAEGLLLYRTGKYAEAEAVLERNLPLREKTLGPDHLDVAISLNNLGLVYIELLKHDKAKAVLERGLRIREKALGPDHPEVSLSRVNLGLVFYSIGDWAAAKPLFESAAASMEKAVGPAHPDMVIVLDNLGLVLLEIGDFSGAESVFSRSLDVAEKKLGADHPRVAEALLGLARAKVHLGQLDAAAPLLERSLSLREKSVGPSHPDVSSALAGIAELHVARGKPELALPLLERALPIGIGTDIGEYQIALAEVLGMLHKDPARARSLAEQSRATYEKLGHRPGAERATRWLAAHP